MYVLMTDETNLNPGANSRFFIYGGLVFPVEVLKDLDALVRDIRTRYHFEPGDLFKFDTHSRPAQVSIADWTSAKSEVIDGCRRLGIRFIAYLILHDIARNRTREELIGFGLNTILHMFGVKFLGDQGDDGIVIVDRLPMGQDYGFLRDKFTKGLTISTNGTTVNLPRIKLYASTCDGASHASSAVDIVLGAFRYCVNQTGSSTIPQTLFPSIARIIWGKRVGDTLFVRDYGLALRPKAIASEAYQAEYDALTHRLVQLAGELPEEA